MSSRRRPVQLSEDTETITGRDLRRVVLSSLVGTTIEWYDFYLYGTAAGIVFNKLYFPSSDPLVGTLLAFATFALGFVARPVGGLLFGHIGDRFGRKKTLVSTMLMMGAATSAIGLIPPYSLIGPLAPCVLVLLRLAQGLAIGGEWGGAVLMSVEYAPSERRGFYGSFPQVGLAMGLMLGTGTLAWLDAVMSDTAFLTWGWRIAFLLSAVLVLLGTTVRSRLLETPAFRKLAQQKQTTSVPIVELAKDRQSRLHALLGVGTRLAEGITFNMWAVFVLSYGTGTLGLSRQPLLVSIVIAAGVMALFIPAFGRLSDAIGRRTTYASGAIAAYLLAFPAFAALGSSNPERITLALVAVLGVGFPLMYGPQAAFYAELFPTPVRYTGSSFVYQFSGIFSSGLTPFVLTYLIGVSGGGHALVLMYMGLATAISVMCTVAVRPLFRARFAQPPTAWWYALPSRRSTAGGTGPPAREPRT